jgi:hypothetical protein
MISSILLYGALIAFAGDGALTVPSAIGEYKLAAAGAHRDPDAQIRLALWCEAHGLTAERLKHLSLAVLYDPANALSRGLMGLVAYRGKWERPDQVGREVQKDLQYKERIQEYLQRRAKAPDRAEDQWKLALWCEQNGLKQQANAHSYRVLQLDPTRDAAWKHLGYKRIGGRWDKPERVAAAKAEAQVQHQANNHWKPILEKLLSGLVSKDKLRQAQAEKGLAEVNDPRAVPMIWVMLVRAGTDRQKLAVRLLGQIESSGSSRALALLALFSRSTEVRRGAIQVLRRRDPRDFASVLIALFRDPIKYEVRPVSGPGSQGQLVIKQPDVNVKRLYTPISAPNVPQMPNDQIVLDGNGLPVLIRELGQYQMGPIAIGQASPAAAAAMFGLSPNPSAAQISGLLMKGGLPAGASQKLGAAISRNMGSNIIDLGGPVRAERMATGIGNAEMGIPIGQMALDAQQSAQVAEQQLQADVQAIENYNAPIVDMNEQVRQVLKDSVGLDLGPDKIAWDKWLVDLSGYAFSAPRSYDDQPTVVEQVPLSYQPQATPYVMSQPVAVAIFRHSCFGAGTPVRTLDGSSEIEKIRAGDLVLTQDSKTGELKYQPVLTAYHNPPNATLRIELGEETIVATGIHRFWKAGRGWVMARDLKPGDFLRTIGGITLVKSVEKEQVQPVFNLQVAEGESFFVGISGVLAHDNSVVNPTPNPFDAVPDLEKPATP